MVGGLNRKHRVDNIIKRISLHIVVNDTDQPSITTDFFKGYQKRSSGTVKDAYTEVERLYDLLTVLMRQVDYRAGEETILVKETIPNDSND
ncbi:hypothetical protein [Virgibacillus ihumii]|uniref:hypothetical protein n=1 Tax=Virgibacillus ihumii TaxID=2686091 RepID=UPI00157C64FC|nr:hypothetical protein [Virgibacillus ihumii]